MRKQFLYYGQAACTFVRKYDIIRYFYSISTLMTAKELFLGGAGHHVEELHPGSIELGLEVSHDPFDQFYHSFLTVSPDLDAHPHCSTLLH